MPLESPSKYPFDIPEPILDSGVETIGSNSTGSDREEAKHQEKVESYIVTYCYSRLFYNSKLDVYQEVVSGKLLSSNVCYNNRQTFSSTLKVKLTVPVPTYSEKTW